MGEMIKFGIKIGLCVATAVALCSALLILFNLFSTFIIAPSQSWHIYNIFQIVSLVFPLNVRFIFTTITTLFSFKVAYWAADKMIEFINAMG